MDRRHQIMEILEKNLSDTIDYFESLTTEQLAMTIYSDEGRWTAMQMAAHLVTIEQSMHWLFNNILSGGAGSPAGFDPDRFNRAQVPKLDGLTLDELLRRLTDVRQETIAIVRSMSDADLDRRGHHAFHGGGTLERFIRWAYEHTDLHLADMDRVVSAGKAP